MWRGLNRRSDTFQVASSHLITTFATLAAIILFVIIGAHVVPRALGVGVGTAPAGLVAAFLLNIAIILFGWRRSKDLAQAMAAAALAEEEARRNAYVDCVTGLANRRALVMALESALKRKPIGGTVALFDLDHFKKVNDLHGHSVGDELLNRVGTTLEQSAPDGSLVARLGGDEFALLMPLTGAEEAEGLVGAALESLATPVSGKFHALLSASAGLACLDSELSAEDLLRRVDIAMYSAKRAGRNGLAWFDSAQEMELRERALLEEEIRKGIDGDEFVPFFQPLISLATGQTTGFEVLARWKSPQRGLVEPAEFIGVCESSGLIAALSMNVMKKALIAAKAWPADLKIAVNISPVQFRDPQLAERVLKLLTETGFPARRLELEITEGSLIENPEQAATVVKSLKNSGITIALDDFGTGYASLTQLQSLPFDRIKIDKSFVGSLGENDQSTAIVKTIASLGKLLCVPITAEGVETETVRRRLAEFGCEDAQGWLFGRAVSATLVGSYFEQTPPETAVRRGGERRSITGKKW